MNKRGEVRLGINEIYGLTGIMATWAPVMVGIFPIAVVSFDRKEPFEVFIHGEISVPVFVEDDDFWQTIEEGLRFRAGDALVARVEWDCTREVMKAVKVFGITNLSYFETSNDVEKYEMGDEP